MDGEVGGESVSVTLPHQREKKVFSVHKLFFPPINLHQIFIVPVIILTNHAA